LGINLDNLLTIYYIIKKVNLMKYELKEIWSGGQYGVDISALAAAKQCGLKTCGWAPKGFKTCYGPRPQLAKLGLIEHESTRYECRTYNNVRDTDGTLLICKDWNSPHAWG
jgi:hypothetical protein